MIYFFVIIHTSLAMETSHCRDFNCSTSGFSMNCIQQTSNIVWLFECTPGYQCPADLLYTTDPLQDSLCEPLDRNSTCTGSMALTTGRVCCTNNDCNSQNCYNGVCTSLSNCTIDEDCNFDSYCVDSNCVNSVKPGKNCTKDAECTAGYACNAKKCTMLLSLDIGIPADDARFCMTGFVYNGVCEAIFVTVNKTLAPNPFVCRIGDICNYTLSYSKQSFDNVSCICSGKSGMTGYCSTYVLYDYDYSVNMYNNINYLSSNCGGIYKSSIDSNILLECGSISNANYIAYTNAYYHALFWNIFQGGILDQCAVLLGIFNPNATFSRYLIPGLLILIFY